MSEPIRADYSLYLVTDRGLLGKRELIPSITAAIKGGVRMLQLREKDLATRDFFEVAREVKAVTDKFRVPLIINDRLDIALAVGASGLHVGQEDLPAQLARKLLGPAKILGVSVTNLVEALQAQADGADYLGVGAIFPTGTKSDAARVGLDTLRLIKQKVRIPVVAIGGINAGNAGSIKALKVDGIAVVSAILSQTDIEAAARELSGLMRSETCEKIL